MESPTRSKTSVNLSNPPGPLPFSDGIMVGDSLYLSGRIGIDPLTGLAPEDVGQELKFLFDGFDAVLAQAGTSMDNLVWVQVFSPDISLWDQFNAEYVKRFSQALPARALSDRVRYFAGAGSR